jgi:hypothetical protein
MGQTPFEKITGFGAYCARELRTGGAMGTGLSFPFAFFGDISIATSSSSTLGSGCHTGETAGIDFTFDLPICMVFTMS